MATRQSSRNSAATQPAACPTSKIDRGPREERPVVPLSILRTHWIKERRLCAVKAYLLATHSDAPAIRARHQTGMQSHGGPQLVAELPQSLKNATASKYFGLSNVRYGSLADILTSRRHVRFTPNYGRWRRIHVSIGCRLRVHALDDSPLLNGNNERMSVSVVACPGFEPTHSGRTTEGEVAHDLPTLRPRSLLLHPWFRVRRPIFPVLAGRES